MADTSVATANTFSKEATLISLAASSPICDLGDSLIRMQSRGRGRVHVIFVLCSKSHSSVPDQALQDSRANGVTVILHLIRQCARSFGLGSARHAPGREPGDGDPGSAAPAVTSEWGILLLSPNSNSSYATIVDRSG